MKQQIYAVYDTCSGLYESPHFAMSDDVVRRQFQDICTAADNPISAHPEHYSPVKFLVIFPNCAICDEERETFEMEIVEYRFQWRREPPKEARFEIECKLRVC